MNNAPASSSEVTRTAEAPRVTIALIPKAAADLAALQDRTSLSKTDVINRAISLYRFFQDQIDAENDIIVRDRDTGEAQLVKLL